MKGRKGFTFKISTVANLRKLFEPYSPTVGLNDGLLQLFQPTRPQELGFEIVVDQPEQQRHKLPTDILELDGNSPKF